MERAPRVAREPGARAAARLHRRRARLAFFALTRDELFAGISVVSLLLGIGYLPFQLGRGFIAAIALARERYEAYAAIELVRTAVLIAVAVVLTFLIGVDGALIGIAASRVVSYVAAAVWAVRYARVAQEKAQAGGGRLREAMTFGSKAWGATLLQLINYRLDLFLLAAYVSRADVGRYSRRPVGDRAGVGAARRARDRDLSAHRRPARGARPRRDRRHGVRRRDGARGPRHSVLLLAPATIIVLLLVVVAVPLLYGPAFTEAVWFGLILIPGVVGLSLGKTLSAVVTGRGRPHYALLTTLITVPLTVALYLLLIPPLGAYGAALASTVSYLTATGLALVWFRRTTQIPLRAALVPSRAELRDYLDALANVRRRLRTRAV